MLTAFLDGAFCQTNSDLKPFQGLWLFLEFKISYLQEEKSKSLKNICEGVDFLSYRLGTYSFTKNEVIHRCSSRILVTRSAGTFTDFHFQVKSFVEQVWCNCSAHHSVHLFVIEISSHTISNGSSHKEFFFNIAD